MMASNADLLREAATLMRQRATTAASRPPWTYVGDEDTGHYSLRDTDGFSIFSEIDGPWDSDLPHIASWHPAVALAVADWLDQASGRVSTGPGECGDDYWDAVSVARTYLGRDGG